MNTAVLVDLSKAFDVALVKARRTPRARTNFKRMMRTNERKIKTKVNEWLDWSIAEIQAGLPKMRGKTAAQKTKSIADWKNIKEQGEIILKPALLDALTDGGKSIVERKIRKQERFDPIGVEAVAWATKHAAELVTEVTDETIKAIRSYITAGVDAGKSVPAISRELRPLVGLTEKNLWAVANYHEKLILDRPELTAVQQNKMADAYAKRLHRDRATTIARTETSASLNEGIREGYGQMGITHLERVEDPDAPDDDCQENNGRIYTLAESQGVLPAHPNCLLGDSLVLPGGRITDVSKRLYNGEIVIIKTASERKLTCTPNHPILSDGGFRPANTLDIGSEIICDGIGQWESFEYWKDINKPASIQEVAESFLKDRKMMTRKVPITTPDFHGDGIGSKVAIISTNRFLVNCFNTSLKQHLLNLQFKRGKIRRFLFDCLSMFTLPFPGDRLTQGYLVGGFDLMFSLSLRHMVPKIFDGFALSSDINIHRLQSLENDASGDIVFSSKSFLRPSRNIKVNNFIDGKVDITKPSISIPNTFIDKITHIETSQYKGFVYNMETTESYYIANGIANHNCEGSWVAA